MTMRDYYVMMNSDYDDVFSRLRKDERILKYLRMFAQSTDLADFEAAYQSKNYADAFRFSHNLKGVSLNLGLTPLSTSSSVLCEAFRSQTEPTIDVEPLLAEVKKAYSDILNVIASIEA